MTEQKQIELTLALEAAIERREAAERFAATGWGMDPLHGPALWRRVDALVREVADLRKQVREAGAAPPGWAVAPTSCP